MVQHCLSSLEIQFFFFIFALALFFLTYFSSMLVEHNNVVTMFPILLFIQLFTCRKSVLLLYFLWLNRLLYLNLPPNVGVQKSLVFSAAIGKVLDMGTMQRPRLLRSCLHPSCSLSLPAACIKYIFGDFFYTPNS